MYKPSQQKLVIFDSAPNDSAYEDRLTLTFVDGQFYREDWVEGELYKIALTPFEACELVDMVGHP